MLIQTRVGFAIDAAFVGQDVALRVGRIEHLIKVERIAFAGRAHDDLAHQLVTLIGVGRHLVAVVGFAVLRYAGGHILQAALGGTPLHWHRSFAGQRRAVLAHRLTRRLHDARVDHLPAARHTAVVGKLPIGRVEDALAGAGFDQALLEGQDRRAFQNLPARSQANEALKTQVGEPLEFHMLAAPI